MSNKIQFQYKNYAGWFNGIMLANGTVRPDNYVNAPWGTSQTVRPKATRTRRPQRLAGRVARYEF